MARLVVIAAAVVVLLSGVGWAEQKAEDAKKQEQTKVDPVAELRAKLEQLERNLRADTHRAASPYPRRMTLHARP
jgi:outer membrane murein-binding lipoprotein Lpp